MRCYFVAAHQDLDLVCVNSYFYILRDTKLKSYSTLYYTICSFFACDYLYYTSQSSRLSIF